MSTHNSIPQHIAIIMDGIGRSAKERGLPRIQGHRAVSESFREVIDACKELGVKFLTLYAFSSENWKRPEEEVSGLMNLVLVRFEQMTVLEYHHLVLLLLCWLHLLLKKLLKENYYMPQIAYNVINLFILLNLQKNNGDMKSRQWLKKQKLTHQQKV